MTNPHRKQTALSIFKDELRNKNKGYSDEVLTKKFYDLSVEKKEEYRFRAKRFNMYLDSESNRYEELFNHTPSVNTKSTINDYCGESTLTTRSQFMNGDCTENDDFEFSQVSTNYPINAKVEKGKNTQHIKIDQNERITKNKDPSSKSTFSNQNCKNQKSSSDSDDWAGNTTPVASPLAKNDRDVSDTDLTLGDDAESFVTYASSTITTVQLPPVNLEELGYCKDAFENPVTTKFYNAEKETKIDITQKKFLIKVLDRMKQAGEDVYDIQWPIIAFEWFYFIPDESPFCLPAEVSLQMFSLNDGFPTKKCEKSKNCEKSQYSHFTSELPFYHEFISSSGHPTNCFGLKAEILNHTCQTNKISLWNDSSSDYAKIYRTILKTALEISKTLTKCDMKLSENSSGGDYILFTDNVTATKESLSFIAEKADMKSHFEKHVKKGVFDFTKFVTVYYHFHGRLDLFNKMTIFEHPRNSLFSNIRCNFHNVDQEAEHSKTCARATVRKMGYTWWQCMKNLHGKYDLKKELKGGAGYSHFPGDRPDVDGVKAIEEVEIDFESFAETMTLDYDTESEMIERNSLIGTAASTFSVTSSFRGLRRRKLAKT